MSFGIAPLAMPEWGNCECERTVREEVVKETLNLVPMCWVWNTGRELLWPCARGLLWQWHTSNQNGCP